MTTPDPSPLYTVAEAAKYLRLGGVKYPSRTISRYMAIGQLGAVQIGRHKLFHKSELDRFIAQKFAEQNARTLPEVPTPGATA